MHTLARVISQIESSNNPRALRFEPAVYSGLKANHLITDAENSIMSIHDCTRETAEIIYSTSFGLYQIMGFNLWGELDYTQTLFNYVADENAQYDMFCEFLQRKQIAFDLSDLLKNKSNLDRFAILYNGSLSYADAIISTARMMGLQ